MATQTSNLQLTKPESTDFYDISVQNENMDRIDEVIAGKADKTDIPIATSSQVGGVLSGSEISVDEEGNAHIELDVLVATDDEEVVAPAPLNADLLGGKTAEYFDNKISANSEGIGKINDDLDNKYYALNCKVSAVKVGDARVKGNMLPNQLLSSSMSGDLANGNDIGLPNDLYYIASIKPWYDETASSIQIAISLSGASIYIRAGREKTWGNWENNTLHDIFMGNVLMLKPENTETGEGGQIILQGATGYKNWIADVYKEAFRIVSSVNGSTVYEFRSDGIYLNSKKIC